MRSCNPTTGKPGVEDVLKVGVLELRGSRRLSPALTRVPWGARGSQVD